MPVKNNPQSTVKVHQLKPLKKFYREGKECKPSKNKVHIIGCNGIMGDGACGGYVRCRSCGEKFGWCQGHDSDGGVCPTCLRFVEESGEVELRYEPLEIQYERNEQGHPVRVDVTPESYDEF